MCDFLAGLLGRINGGFSPFLRALRHLLAALRPRVAAESERLLGAIGRFDHQLSTTTIDFLDRSLGLLQTVISELVDLNRGILGSSLRGVRHDFPPLF